MHESDRISERAIEQAERARGKLMSGDRAGAVQALKASIESSAEALRLLGYTVQVEIEETGA